MKKNSIILAGIAGIVIIGGLYVYPPAEWGLAVDPGSAITDREQASRGRFPEIKMNKALGIQRPGFTLKDLAGKPHAVSEWDGKVLVVNFWATWCPPCRNEMPLFVALQKQYGDQGLQFLGIALDEVFAVQDFTDNFEVNYPILIGENDAVKITKAYGNHLGALPYTAIIDRQGKIDFVQPGELTRQQAEPAIKKLL
jgi:thiol-disulfide isomerase/thioredoxin